MQSETNPATRNPEVQRPKPSQIRFQKAKTDYALWEFQVEEEMATKNQEGYCFADQISNKSLIKM